jgi:predicted AAA+ superfamily ATPase
MAAVAVVGGVAGVSYAYVNTRNRTRTQPFEQRATECSMSIGSNEENFVDVARYIYHLTNERLHRLYYDERKVVRCRDWRNRTKAKDGYLKYTMPSNESFAFKHMYQDTEYQIEGSLTEIRDTSGDQVKLLSMNEFGQTSETFYERIDLRSCGKEVLMDVVDEAKVWAKARQSELNATVQDSMNIYYYKKDFWMLLSKTPKRSLDTIYLKKGEKERIMESVSAFFSKGTRDVYLSFGIPYKNTVLIHGPPGTGKTSMIKSIASTLDCDLYILPITKDLLDNDIVDAFSYINEKEDKERIVVIEDVDTLFEDRKVGDSQNGITLQGLLNCMDGSTSMEGTMLFITANRPEVLDFAMIRSCRIDRKFELTYADEFQTRHMFTRFFPTQTDSFHEFYRSIQHKDYTTAMLQEFFFYNRDSESIVGLLDEFHQIITQNDPKSFEVLKDENKNCYM